jgi:hypothetical protein
MAYKKKCWESTDFMKKFQQALNLSLEDHSNCLGRFLADSTALAQKKIVPIVWCKIQRFSTLMTLLLLISAA